MGSMYNIIINFKNIIKKYFELTRAYALGVTFASCFVIFSWAQYSERFTLFNFLLIVLGLACVHLGANLFDDYIDVKLKMNDGTSLQNIHFNSFAPKARLIKDGTFSFKKVELILSILFSIAILIGIYFAFYIDWKVLIFALIGGILTLFYPISARFYLAEIIIGLIYGPLMIMGGFYALTGLFSFNLFLLSIAIFFSTLVLLHVHSLMDWEFDIVENKKTLCILSGSKENAIKVLQAFIIIAYSIISICVFMGYFNPKMLYVFLTLPLSIKLVESMKDYIQIKDAKFETRWYYGFFENWEEIKQNKIDFFMYRFYLARNFSLFFAILASIGAML